MEFVAKIVGGAGACEFRGLKFAGGKIDVGQADGRAGGVRGHRGEKIIFAGVENGPIGRRARGDHANDFAADDFFAGAGLLHLIANGNLETGADQAGDVAVGGVVGDAAHRNRLTLFAIARGQGDLQFAGGEDGVFVEQFVEIAETEEE